MMQMAHHRYNLLFRWMHETLTIHHFALLLFKNYLTIQVGMLQRIHCQYNRYESALDDTLIGNLIIDYGNSLALFTNTIDDLILQLPLLIKLKVQVPMSLYSVDAVPVPFDAETYTGAK